MTQRDRILYELRQAGEAGVRSDRWFALSMPRAAARIQELRDAGHNITSERCGKYVTYRLQSWGRTGNPNKAGAAPSTLDATPASVQHSGPQAAGRALPGAPPRPQSVPEPLFGESALERMQDAA